MSLKNLHNLDRIIDSYEQQKLGSTSLEQFELLKGLQFYDWATLPDSGKVDNTFNQAIGLPQKNGIEYPLFDYEQLLFNALQEHKHIWIKKATGLGNNC